MRAPARVLLCLAGLLAPAAARASCGAASCPIDTHSFNQPEPGEWTVDLGFEYIDQDRPRIGTHGAEVGELPSEHDEVRTINRRAILTLGYAPSTRWLLALRVPWVSRFHEHLEGDGHGGEEPVAPDGGEQEAALEQWSLHGVGDVGIDAQLRVWTRDRSSLYLRGGVELPTGKSDLDNDEGEVAEPAIQPGSDSTDVVVGATFRGSILRNTARRGALGHTTILPYFVSTSFRRNGSGRDGYRLGDEWQLNAGGARPFGQRFDALLQLNARHRGKDGPGNTEEDPDFTGGTWIYVSPGVRVASGPWAGYLYVQLPVYQDVNQLQIVSRANWLVGVQHRF